MVPMRPKGRDVRQRPQPLDAGRDVGRVLENRLFDRLGDLNLAPVGAGEARANHLGQRRVRSGAAQLHRAVDVARQHQLGDLLHEGRSVEVVAKHQRDDPLDDHGDRAGQPEDVDQHERPALFEELDQPIERASFVGGFSGQHHIENVVKHHAGGHFGGYPFDYLRLESCAVFSWAHLRRQQTASATLIPPPGLLDQQSRKLELNQCAGQPSRVERPRFQQQGIEVDGGPLEDSEGVGRVG